MWGNENDASGPLHLGNSDLPTDIDDLGKLRCPIQHDMKIGWWHVEDEEYLKEYGDPDENIANNPPYQGLIVAQDDTELRGGLGSDLDPEDCLVIMHCYPVEKCYCASVWVALGWLLDNPDVVAVVALP